LTPFEGLEKPLGGLASRRGAERRGEEEWG